MYYIPILKCVRYFFHEFLVSLSTKCTRKYLRIVYMYTF